MVAGISMARKGELAHLVWLGLILAIIGNVILISLDHNSSSWIYFVYLIPANFGQGMVYPALLFKFVSYYSKQGVCLDASI